MQFTSEMVHDIMHAIFTGRYDEKLTKLFESWETHDSKGYHALAEELGVNLEELKKGNPLEMCRMMAQHQNPLKEISNVLLSNWPIIQHRIKTFPPIPEEERSPFRNASLEQLVRDVEVCDWLHTSEYTASTVERLLNIYGFVKVDSNWSAQGIGGRVPIDFPTIMDSPLVLPYDDYMLTTRSTRGTEVAVLTLHHTRKGVQQNTYHARTLQINRRIIDAPVKQYHEVLATKVGRDPLSTTFQEGFIVQFENNFFYHPRHLLKALIKNLHKPEHEYFFIRSLGIRPELIGRPDLDEQEWKTQDTFFKLQTEHGVPEGDESILCATQEIPINFRKKAQVDMWNFMPILRTTNAKRLDGIKSLGNIQHDRMSYATQSRMIHQIGVKHFAGMICAKLGIDGYDRLKVETYGLVHDWGHLTGSHATEEYFRALCGFDHDEFAKSVLLHDREAIDKVVRTEDIIAMFEHKDPLHQIVDGPFGADRMYYLSIDPNECGLESNYDPTNIIPWLGYRDGVLFVDQNIDEATRFLEHRAAQYERLYFSPATQVADAYQKKMLHKLGIRDVHEIVKIRHNNTIAFVRPGGVELPFWQLNDIAFQYHLANHENPDVREIMRHLLITYHRTPHTTVATLHLPGAAEPKAEFPMYPELVYGELAPCVEHTTPEFLKAAHKKWQQPSLQYALEAEIANCTGMPERHVIVASVPNLAKLGSEYAPVRIDSSIKSLFAWEPERGKPFVDRATRMAGLRVAVHPQFCPYIWNYFQDKSFLEVVRRVYELTD